MSRFSGRTTTLHRSHFRHIGDDFHQPKDEGNKDNDKEQRPLTFTLGSFLCMSARLDEIAFNVRHMGSVGRCPVFFFRTGKYVAL